MADENDYVFTFKRCCTHTVVRSFVVEHEHTTTATIGDWGCCKSWLLDQPQARHADRQYGRQSLAKEGKKILFEGGHIATDTLGKTLATAPPRGCNFSCGVPWPPRWSRRCWSLHVARRATGCTIEFGFVVIRFGRVNGIIRRIITPWTTRNWPFWRWDRTCFVSTSAAIKRLLSLSTTVRSQ